MARPRKSDEQKMLEGSYQWCRGRPDAPKPTKGVPIKPPHLSDKAASVWEQIAATLIGMRVLTVADSLAVETLAEAYADLRAAREALAKRGGALTYDTRDKHGNIMVRAYPEFAMVQSADATFSRALSKCGLTPVDRLKVKAMDDSKDDNPFAEI